MNDKLSIALMLVSAATWGCVSDTEVGSDVSDAGGTLTAVAGKTVPPSGEVYVSWTVSSGSPDYSVLFGRGSSSGPTFRLDLPSDPPTEALNSYGIGIGVVFLMPDGYDLPAGRIPETDEFEMHLGNALGAAGRYAVIYKEAGATDLHWSADFPDGYSCGVEDPARREAPGSGFEGYAPVDCSDIEIQVDDIDNIDFTNWT